MPVSVHERFFDSPIRTLASIGGVVLLAVMIGLYIYATQRLTDSAELVSHTREAETQLNSLLSGLQDAEIGQRGFLLTGRDYYLDPYDSARQQVAGHMTELRMLIEDHPEQLQSAELLESLIIEKFAELQQTIDLFQHEDAEAALKLVLSDAGKDTMDRIRGLVQGMLERESVILATLQERASLLLPRHSCFS